MAGDRRRPSFSFIVHPRFLLDLRRVPAINFVERYSSSEEDLLRKVRSIKPLVLGEINFGITPFHGELIGVLRLPEELTGKNGSEAVAEGVALAVRRGARVVGLGGLTAPATGGGHRLLRSMPSGTTLTNGNAFTAAVVFENVVEAISQYAGAGDLTVGVLGCTGSVGTPATQLLSENKIPLILVGRNVARLHSKFNGLKHAALTSDICHLRGATIIVLLTSDPTAKLLPSHVSSGTIVIDCAQPPNIDYQTSTELASMGCRVYEGGIVEIPDYSTAIDFGFADNKATFACLAETYLFSRMGINTHSTGAPSSEFAKQLRRMAARAGIKIRPLTPK
jgi:predicted amino acid dehydrogenase